MTKQKVQIFFSYAHQDSRLVKQFMTHLASLKREDSIELWSDSQIRAGDPWEASISKMLNKADIILLFVTPDFIDSTYCYEKEMKRALERHKAGSACVIPIIVRPTADWTKTPLGELQAIPEGGKAVTTWINRDVAWASVAKQIREAIQVFAYEALPIKEPAELKSAERSGLTFASIAIDVQNKDWAEEHRPGDIGAQVRGFSRKYIQHFSTEHQKADPCFDITLMNISGKPILLTEIGVEIICVWYEGVPFGGLPAYKVKIDDAYTISMPDIRGKTSQYFNWSSHYQPHDLYEIVSMHLPDPIYFHVKAPYRYKLLLEKYEENMPNSTILRMWIHTNQGQGSSHEILLSTWS